MNNGLPPDVVQVSFLLSAAHRDEVLAWCNLTLGIRATYPRGKWTYFPFYSVGGVDCIRVVLYHKSDQLAFTLVWGKYILQRKVD